MKTNVKRADPDLVTHEGARAARITPEEQLRRSVMACLLWEGSFYEDGESVVDRIVSLVPKVSSAKVAALAVEARTEMNLRHVPLLLCRELARNKALKEATLASVIQRADEMTEFLSLYWKDGRRPLAAQAKKGLASVFHKFDEYQLAKYNRPGAVKLRDVLRLCRPRPVDAHQEALWGRVLSGELKTPDTWEVALSAGGDKKETWERLLAEGKLGALALLRNLRNMEKAKVKEALVHEALLQADVRRVLPFRFVAAAYAAPRYEEAIDSMMLRSLSQQAKLPGKSLIVVDVSGSMYHSNVSEKSEMTRAQAACALGAIARELCVEARIYATAGNDSIRKHRTAEVPARRGMALVDAIYRLCKPLGGGGIFLTPVLRWLEERETDVDRTIVITDEQDCALDAKDAPTHAKPFGTYNYLLNVATYKNGIGYKGRWTHIDGFSEAVFKYILHSESTGGAQ